MNPLSPKINFAPPLTALRQISFWLQSNQPPHIILAKLAHEQMLEQRLPYHCTVTKRHLAGVRKPVRGRRKTGESRFVVARWPDDGLLESDVPELMFIIGGEGDLRLADYTLHCRKGDVIYVPSRVPKFDGLRPVYEMITPESHCDILFVRSHPAPDGNVSISISHSRGDWHGWGKEGEACWLKNLHIKQLFALFSDLIQDKQNHKSTFYLLCALVTLLHDNIKEGNAFDSLTFPSESMQTLRQGSIKQALEYMQNHLSQPLTISQVARWVGLSRTIFTTRFREKTGKSFKEYQTELRLDKAKVLLRDTNFTIEQISDRIGITPGQLRQLFHQKYGCPPREFRYSKKKRSIIMKSVQ